MRALYAVDLEDDSETGAEGLREGRQWLERLGASVELLFVEPPVPPMLGVGDDEEVVGMLEAAIRQREQRLGERLEGLLAAWPPELRGSVHVAYGATPANEITTRASEYDLVVVGTRGLRGLSRAWLGSVAEKVVRASPVPVLVVRGPGSVPAAPSQALRLLVAVDGWDASADVLVAEAARWADRLGATVDLLHAIVPPIPLAGPGAAGALQMEALFHDAELRVERLASELPAEVRGTSRAAWGDAASAIVVAAENYGLVLVGTHGRTGLGRLWLGSVAERVVRRAPTSVLVVPTRG